jgi:hypothetical protein
MADDVNMTTPLDPNDPDNLADLEEEEDEPDAPPDDVKDYEGDHQQKDTNLEKSEVVDVGTDIAANINDPLRNGPPKDRKPEYADQEGYDSGEPNEDDV